MLSFMKRMTNSKNGAISLVGVNFKQGIIPRPWNLFSHLDFDIAWDRYLSLFFPFCFLPFWLGISVTVSVFLCWMGLHTYPTWKSPSLGPHLESSPVSYFHPSFSHDYILSSVEKFYKWACIILVFFSTYEFYTLTRAHVQYLAIYLNVSWILLPCLLAYCICPRQVRVVFYVSSKDPVFL